nr:MAG TPA: hypothetical protein [Caudoviricetes sp.]
MISSISSLLMPFSFNFLMRFTTSFPVMYSLTFYHLLSLVILYHSAKSLFNYQCSLFSFDGYIISRKIVKVNMKITNNNENIFLTYSRICVILFKRIQRGKINVGV